ncbi:hypothetical protein AGMMS50262_11940 [Bacteroidia bacterium]|nr:hypothetical protein AGMMS50262_11940 [Bacteroidia bacterium]
MRTNKVFILGTVLFALILFCSCDHEVTDIYHYRIDYVEGNSQGAQIIYDYANSKGVFTGDQAYTSNDTRDNDNKALDWFDENAAKIKRSELKDLLSNRSWIYDSRVVFFYEVYTGSAANPVMIESKEFVIDPKTW